MLEIAGGILIAAAVLVFLPYALIACGVVLLAALHFGGALVAWAVICKASGIWIGDGTLFGLTIVTGVATSACMVWSWSHPGKVSSALSVALVCAIGGVGGLAGIAAFAGVAAVPWYAALLALGGNVGLGDDEKLLLAFGLGGATVACIGWRKFRAAAPQQDNAGGTLPSPAD